MMASRNTPSVLLLLVVFAWASSAVPTATPDTQRVIPTEMAPSRAVQSDGDEDRITEREAQGDDLFDDMDPKTLAAILLGALNHTRAESRRDEDPVTGDEPEGEERDRDGRLKLELLMASQAREEKKKAEEEEERMTERVSSRTTSQTVPARKQPPAEQGAEEEQLNPEELKNLETMMKEFPRLDTAAKRAGEPNQRESRGYSSYNDIIPFNKGNNVALSKKKLKWQEESQQNLNVPSFRGNFMDDFKDTPLPDEDEEEEEETLSPQEEEARAKAEQEEMRRQAAEVQRAKMEEEKLADIASDMLLRYMVKQNGGGRKYSSSSPNAAEDKRSEEEQEEDDIDPQTIDKLIEISSKLHLPADDVVDIISDVEKKKKKDVNPQMPLSSFPDSESGPITFPLSKQPSPSRHLLKNWFQEQSPTKSKEFWSTPVSKPYMWTKALKPVKQSPWSWTRYPYTRPSFYPVYFPPPRPTYRYYVPNRALALNTFLQRSPFQPKQRYLNWVQPRFRKPPTALLRKPFYPRYRLPSRPLAAPRFPPPQDPFYQSPPKGYLSDSKGQLEKYIEQLLMKRPRVQD
ncbi:neurosecretory protein VGF [Syngnathus scovelli]|uniref:neurosecretory protein VGF n=1 Tax=Syngnathus scovelli TaxID=161590 RepID=UPI0021108281|nr:neurosecretory protein VGF [Syngnathus scovelli]